MKKLKRGSEGHDSNFATESFIRNLGIFRLSQVI